MAIHRFNDTLYRDQNVDLALITYEVHLKRSLHSYDVHNTAVPATEDSPAVPKHTPVETSSEEDSDPDKLQKDKYMQKNLALIAKHFKKLYNLPTTTQTSSNTRNKNVDTNPRYKNDNQTGQFGNQRVVNVVGARETVGGPVVQQSGIQCFNCKDMVALRLRNVKAKRVKDPLIIHERDVVVVKQAEKDDQNDVECDDERVALANLIANLKLDVDENKKIQKQLKKANATLTQELTECKSILAETSRTLGESNSIRDSCLVALQNKQTEFERYKAFNDRTVDYDKLEHKLNEALGLLAQKEIDIKEGLKVKAYEISVVKEKHDEINYVPLSEVSISKTKFIQVKDCSKFERTDEILEVLKDISPDDIPQEISSPVISVRTDRGTKFLNKTLHAFFKEEGIEHQTSTPRTPEQNGVVERQNRTLVEAARTMLSAC
ncbi:retrovirus-related pol polyprotein from transposon TNT 1-94 [Tanacetum coccineum]